MTTPLNADAKQRLDALLTDAVQKGLVPAASFAFCDTNKVLYSGWAGQQTMDNPKGPSVDRNSVYWICSQTKFVMAIALLQLMESGKIAHDTPVESIIPELANPIVIEDFTASPPTYRPAAKTMQMRHLLNHTSGLAYRLSKRVSQDGLSEPYTAECYGGNHSVNKFFELLKMGLPSVPLAFEPGDDWAYGWSCDIAAFVVERIAGTSIEAYCQEHIFGPLGMDTTFYLTSTVKSRLVDLAVRQPDRSLKKWDGSPGISEQDPLQMNFCLGGIGLYSTTEGYLALLRHVLQIKSSSRLIAHLIIAGKATKPIISQQVANQLFEPTLEEHAIKPIEDFTSWPHLQYGQGLCLNTQDWPGRRRKGSGFWYGWAGTYYFMDPTTGVAAAFGAQVIPTKDQEVYELWERLEKEMYSVLGVVDE
ncbi:beta-lactamase/transpeptidase-like protein [Panaeolus papilionaceus]|nr:beta-lactamase/transpeptidase-like protein [Panaeolus papilionaceus]